MPKISCFVFGFKLIKICSLRVEEHGSMLTFLECAERTLNKNKETNVIFRSHSLRMLNVLFTNTGDYSGIKCVHKT